MILWTCPLIPNETTLYSPTEDVDADGFNNDVEVSPYGIISSGRYDEVANGMMVLNRLDPDPEGPINHIFILQLVDIQRMIPQSIAEGSLLSDEHLEIQGVVVTGSKDDLASLFKIPTQRNMVGSLFMETS